MSPTPPPQTLTELLSRVDWSQMVVIDNGPIRHCNGLFTPVQCPLYIATTAHDYQASAAMITGIDSDSIWHAIVEAADFAAPNNSIQARWRHWMLEQIHASQTVTEQP